MSSYEATVEWHLGAGDSFLARDYSRAHHWTFDGGADVPASASPSIVGVEHSDPAGVDPEEALVAALASCHMLFFLDLAARAGVRVTSYVDHAIGRMGKREDGKVAMLGVTLRPEASFSDPADPGIVASLHDEAHELCFIANSVNFPVSVESVA